MRSKQLIKPDAKRRVYLGPLSVENSNYHLLEARLFKNKEALRRVRKGMKQSEGNKLKDRGSFAQYTTLKI